MCSRYIVLIFLHITHKRHPPHSSPVKVSFVSANLTEVLSYIVSYITAIYWEYIVQVKLFFLVVEIMRTVMPKAGITGVDKLRNSTEFCRMTLLIHALDTCAWSYKSSYTTCWVQNEIVYASRFILGSDGFNFLPYCGNANLLVLDENWMFSIAFDVIGLSQIGQNFEKCRFGSKFANISILVKIFQKSRFWSKFSKISILVKLSKNLEFGQICRKMLILVKLVENSRFW